MKKQVGLSFARLVLVAAVLGGVAGVLLARSREEKRSPEEIAEEEVNKVMAQGAATQSTMMDPDPASLAGIPPYPKASPRKLTSRGTLQNTPASISWFQTKDSPDQVLAFYEKAFAAEHRQATQQSFSPTMGYIGWMEEAEDGGAGLLHMVSVMKQYEQTMVLVSASRPEAILDNRALLPGGLKLPPGASRPQVVNLGEGALSNEVLYARVSNMSGPELVSFFEQQFKAGNFVITESTATAAQFSVTAIKSGITVVVGARNEGSHLSIVLTYSKNQQQEAFP